MEGLLFVHLFPEKEGSAQINPKLFWLIICILWWTILSWLEQSLPGGHALIHKGSLNGLISMKMILRYDHRDQISIQLNTKERYWTCVIVISIIKTPTEISLWRTVFIPPVPFQKLESLPRHTEVVLEAFSDLAPYCDTITHPLLPVWINCNLTFILGSYFNPNFSQF